MSLNGRNQYVLVRAPYVTFSYTSFTVEAWIYPRNLTAHQDYVIFTQCTSTTLRKCLLLMFRNASLRMAFHGDDCQTSSVVNENAWYHVAFVYDYSTTSKIVYLDGKIVCENATSLPYEGSNASICIGARCTTSAWPWNGCIDELSFVHRAKNASEIIDDATLVVHYSFDDAGNSTLDSGPLGINAMVGNNIYSQSNGYMSRCLLFSGLSPSSFVQMSGLRRLGTQNYSFSFALWLKPTSVNNGTIVHLSSNTQGTGWCGKSIINLFLLYSHILFLMSVVTLMGFSARGQLVNSIRTTTSLVNITSMVLPTHSWTHIVSTYSVTNGLRLYINGTLFGSVNGFIHSADGSLMTVTLGNSLNGSNCTSAVPSVPYEGFMDEFRLYSRELSQADICELNRW